MVLAHCGKLYYEMNIIQAISKVIAARFGGIGRVFGVIEVSGTFIS